MFDRWGITNDADEEEDENSECSGAGIGSDAECLGFFSVAFCEIVEEDETQSASRNLTSEDILSGDYIKGVITGVLRRSLNTRRTRCASHGFNFKWTDADGDCHLSYSDAFQSLQSLCFNTFFNILSEEGTLNVGCGTYKYQAFQLEDATTSSTAIPTTAPPVTEVATTEEAATEVETTAVETISESSPSPTVSYVPLELQGSGCVNEDDMLGHVEIKEGGVKIVALVLCDELNLDGIVSCSTSSDTSTYKKDIIDYNTNKHRVSISWIQDCAMEDDMIDLAFPLGRGQDDCVRLITSAWKLCKYRHKVMFSATDEAWAVPSKTCPRPSTHVTSFLMKGRQTGRPLFRLFS